MSISKYLFVILTQRNEETTEIKARLQVGYKYYHGLSKSLKRQE